MARLDIANDIINDAALEIGLPKDTDPVGSEDEAFIQLTGLLSSAGRELVKFHDWQNLRQTHQIVTTSTDTGGYDLPDDFSHMINQTGWEYSNRLPMGGPLSAQEWTYLAGRNLVSESIYASFRLTDHKFYIYPEPPPDGLDINFEYVSRNWLYSADAVPVFREKVVSGSDTVMFEPILVVKLLKAKFLEAKGFDASSARLEFTNMFNSMTGKDEGSGILNAGGNGYNYPYLDGIRNVSDTNYGIP